MYQTSRSWNISTEFLYYAEKHGLFELFQRCISSLLINRPDNPIAYLIDLLKKDSDVPKIIIFGPPGSGHHTIAKMLQKKLNTILIEPNELSRDISSQFKDKLLSDPTVNNISSSWWIQLYEERLKDFDCRRRGWILIDFPFNHEQVSALQMKGICPKHVVCLEGSDHVLIEHAMAMRIDSKIKDTQDNFIQLEEYAEKNMIQCLQEYRKNINEIKDCFKSILRTINVDQTLNDVFTQVYSYTMEKPCSITSYTPRILILGPMGSGRKTLAMKISQKYDIPIVSIPTLIKQQIAKKTSIGMSMKSYVIQQSLVPDSLLMQIIRERLNENDCLNKGWIMIDFPRTIEQAESLSRIINLSPNRIFFLDLSLDLVLERLTQHTTNFDEIIRKRYRAYMIYSIDLKDFYSQYDAIHISANQDVSIIFEVVEATFINPILK